jgi:hypothetical protein
MMDERATGTGGIDDATAADGFDPGTGTTGTEDATGGWTVIPESSPPPAGAVRPTRWRWWIAIVATVLVVGSAAGVALVATRGAGASPTLGYVPANAIVYAEGRLDAPGDQGVALASFLSNFPGFTDTSNVQSKLSQAWDRLFRAILRNTWTYSADVAPWVQGTVAIAVLPGASPSSPAALALVAVADQAKAQAELDKIVATARSAGASPAQTTVSGATVWTFSPPSGSSGPAGSAPDHAVSVSLLPGVLVAASDPAVIGSVRDVKDGRAAGLEGSQAYRDATSGAASSDLASIYVSTSALQQEMRSLVPSGAPIASPLAAPLAACAAQGIPVSAYGTLRAQADRLVADLRAQKPAGGTPSSPHVSTLVDHVPGTALAYIETHDAGKALACILGQVKAAIPAAPAGGSDQLGQIEGLVGGQLESFVSWMGDAGIVVNAPTNTQATPSVALIASVTDPTLAAQRLGQLQSLVALATMAGTQGLRISDSRHGATTITTLSISSAMLALPGSIGGAGGTTATVSISWALADGGDPKLGGRFILALGPDAVAALLDQQPAQSLGSTPAFTDALASAGGPSTTGFSYFDLRAIRAAVESVMPAGEKPAYESDVRPYLLPFDRLVTVNGVSGSTVTSRAIIAVGNPQ